MAEPNKCWNNQNVYNNNIVALIVHNVNFNIAKNWLVFTVWQRFYCSQTKNKKKRKRKILNVKHKMGSIAIRSCKCFHSFIYCISFFFSSLWTREEKALVILVRQIMYKLCILGSHIINTHIFPKKFYI